MSVLSTEAMAGIRLLVCMAKADGVLKADERFVIEDALAGIKLPDGITVESLIAESHDPAALADEVKTTEARDYTYASVYSIAYCDRDLHDAEEKILNVLREKWNIARGEEKALERTLEPVKNAEAAGPTLPAIEDEQQREKEFGRMLQTRCILAGITGAIPIPFVSDILVVPIQVQMVYDIAALFGRKNDKKTIQLLVETFLGGAFARVGISALCKAVPIWGSVVGATTSYATTFALGKVAYAFYKSDGKKSMDSLKQLYREEQQHGREEYAKQKDALEQAQRTHSKKLTQLAYDLQSGKISQEEYQKQIDGFA
jgi:uncharacterized protein (DUF697 family)